MKSLLLIYFVVISINNTSAQYGSSGSVDARSTAMAKSYSAVSSGIYAIGINPANLLRYGTPSFSFSALFPVPSVSAGSGSDFFSLDNLNYFFGGVDGKARLLSERDKAELSSLFENGGSVFAGISIRLFSAAYRDMNSGIAFAFSIDDYAGINSLLPQAAVDLILTGNETGNSFNFNNTQLKSSWLRYYSFSAAARLFTLNSSATFLSAGVTFKLVHGFYYAGSDKMITEITTSQDNSVTGSSDMRAYAAFSPDLGVNYDFDKDQYKSNLGLFPEPAGRGFGIDLGLSLVIENNLNVSASVTDAGSISWNTHAAEFTSIGSFYLDDIFNDDQLESLKQKFKGKGKSLAEFSTALPTALRLGISLLILEAVPGTLLLAVDYNQGFNDLPGNSIIPRFSAGAEWKPMDWLPFIRSGFSYGGFTGFDWAFGIGIDAGLIDFDLATSDMQSFFAPNTAKIFSVAFNSKWKF